MRIRELGFTLAEMMFTMAIGSFIIAAVVTSYVFCLKGFRGLSSYNEIQADGRRALDWFGRDLRAGLMITSCTSNQLVTILPAVVNSAGQVTASNVVSHVCQNGNWYRIDGTGNTTLLAENVAQFRFGLYDATGNITTQASAAVAVQVDALLQKRVSRNPQSTDFVSASYSLRNPR